MNMRFLINEVVSHEEIKDLVYTRATETARDLFRQPSKVADLDDESFNVDKRHLLTEILELFKNEADVDIEMVAIEIDSILDEYWDYYLEKFEREMLTLRKSNKKG